MKGAFSYLTTFIKVVSKHPLDFLKALIWVKLFMLYSKYGSFYTVKMESKKEETRITPEIREILGQICKRELEIKALREKLLALCGEWKRKMKNQVKIYTELRCKCLKTLEVKHAMVGCCYCGDNRFLECPKCGTIYEFCNCAGYEHSIIKRSEN